MQRAGDPGHRLTSAERLGHSMINVTLNVYSHVTATMQREAAATFDRPWELSSEPWLHSWLQTPWPAPIGERNRAVSSGNAGADPGTRTRNLRFTKPLLCQLS